MLNTELTLDSLVRQLTSPAHRSCDLDPLNLSQDLLAKFLESRPVTSPTTGKTKWLNVSKCTSRTDKSKTWIQRSDFDLMKEILSKQAIYTLCLT